MSDDLWAGWEDETLSNLSKINNLLDKALRALTAIESATNPAWANFNRAEAQVKEWRKQSD